MTDGSGSAKGIRRRVTVKGKIRMPPLKTVPFTPDPFYSAMRRKAARNLLSGWGPWGRC